MNSTEFYVVGETEDGSRFRPGDWADRLSGLYGRVDQGTVRYTDEVSPVLLQGKSSVRVKSEDYRVRQGVILFALENNLTLVAKDLEH
jgi:hypothetical protein